MTQIHGMDSPGVIFEVIAARISEENNEKKHVLYTLQIRYVSNGDDMNPSIIERRYTQFLNLYNALKKDFPHFMTNVIFPRRVLTGNFDSDLISFRCMKFQGLMKLICSESVLRLSTAMQVFLQEPEINIARDMAAESKFVEATEILEKQFKLLNKVFSDRSPTVLITLCRLIACLVQMPPKPQHLKWADVALHRFNGVSDSDLLELYVPLIHACIKIYSANQQNTTDLEKQLDNFRRQGLINQDKTTDLQSLVWQMENSSGTSPTLQSNASTALP